MQYASNPEYRYYGVFPRNDYPLKGSAFQQASFCKVGLYYSTSGCVTSKPMPIYRTRSFRFTRSVSYCITRTPSLFLKLLIVSFLFIYLFLFNFFLISFSFFFWIVFFLRFLLFIFLQPVSFFKYFFIITVIIIVFFLYLSFLLPYVLSNGETGREVGW